MYTIKNRNTSVMRGSYFMFMYLIHAKRKWRTFVSIGLCFSEILSGCSGYSLTPLASPQKAAFSFTERPVLTHQWEEIPSVPG